MASEAKKCRANPPRFRPSKWLRLGVSACEISEIQKLLAKHSAMDLMGSFAVQKIDFAVRFIYIAESLSLFEHPTVHTAPSHKGGIPAHQWHPHTPDIHRSPNWTSVSFQCHASKPSQRVAQTWESSGTAQAKTWTVAILDIWGSGGSRPTRRNGCSKELGQEDLGVSTPHTTVTKSKPQIAMPNGEYLVLSKCWAKKTSTACHWSNCWADTSAALLCIPE